MMENKKYIGISIFGFLFIVLAISYLLSGIFGIMVFEGKLNINHRIIITIMGIAFFAIGLGVLRLKEWARKATFLLSGYLIYSVLKQDIVQLFIRREQDLFLYIYYFVFLFICASPIIYFSRRKVKEQFKRKS